MLALEWSSFSLTPRRAHAAVIFDIPIEVNTSDLKKAECGGVNTARTSWITGWLVRSFHVLPMPAWVFSGLLQVTPTL